MRHKTDSLAKNIKYMTKEKHSLNAISSSELSIALPYETEHSHEVSEIQLRIDRENWDRIRPQTLSQYYLRALQKKHSSFKRHRVV